MENSENLGNIIRRGRMKKGLTQIELSKLLNVNKQTIYLWEKNQYSPDGKFLIALGNVLDIVDDLFPNRKIDMETRLTRIENALLSIGIKVENNSGIVSHVNNGDLVVKK